MNPSRFESLDAALASVPREVRPGRELWPDIERTIGRGIDGGGSPLALRAPWPMALAASVLMASLVGALCWSVARERTSAELLAQRTPAGGAASTPVNFQLPQDVDYVAARAALERTFNERLELLAPATRERVRADLATIRKANADISAALAQDPASPLLWQLMRNTWQQEINLYTSVAQTTQSMLTRSSRS
jgi:hypothetical protein